MQHIPQTEHQDFALYNVPPRILNHDISLFLEYNLGIIRQEWTLGADWPGKMILRQLVLRRGLFIWAATACRFIREGRRSVHKKVETILNVSSSTDITPEKHLSEIYLDLLEKSISSDYSKEEAREKLKHTLGSMVVLFSPLPRMRSTRHLRIFMRSWIYQKTQITPSTYPILRFATSSSTKIDVGISGWMIRRHIRH
jgi:hypothetical protein